MTKVKQHILRVLLVPILFISFLYGDMVMSGIPSPYRYGVKLIFYCFLILGFFYCFNLNKKGFNLYTTNLKKLWPVHFLLFAVILNFLSIGINSSKQEKQFYYKFGNCSRYISIFSQNPIGEYLTSKTLSSLPVDFQVVSHQMQDACKMMNLKLYFESEQYNLREQMDLMSRVDGEVPILSTGHFLFLASEAMYILSNRGSASDMTIENNELLKLNNSLNMLKLIDFVQQLTNKDSLLKRFPSIYEELLSKIDKNTSSELLRLYSSGEKEKLEQIIKVQNVTSEQYTSLLLWFAEQKALGEFKMNLMTKYKSIKSKLQDKVFKFKEDPLKQSEDYQAIYKDFRLLEKSK